MKVVIVGSRQNVHCLVNVLLQLQLIYQAMVETINKKETYIGLSAPLSKPDLEGIKALLNMKKETTLSKYILELKGENIPYTISWKIMDRAQPF